MVCSEASQIRSGGKEGICRTGLFLWVDAVGSYWVRLEDRVRLGRAGLGREVEIPILADLARHHASIVREGDDYLIEPQGPVSLNGRAISSASPLTDGAYLRFGETVHLRFCRPHPLSATARLEFVSGPRTQPTVDAILLMAGTCILGPSSTAHVLCRDWQTEVIVYRNGDQLYCKGPETLEVNGRVYRTPVLLCRYCQVRANTVSFAVEPGHRLH